MSHHYAIGGWTVRSAIELPALPMPPAPADIIIEVTEERPQIAAPIEIGDNWAVAKRDWLVWTTNGHAVRVQDGRLVSLWAQKGDIADGAALFLPGAAFTAIAYMNRRTPFHGSALALPGGAVIILGDRTAGKSTLAVALATRGHRPIADDLCLPDWQADRFLLRPVFPRLRAYPATLAHFGLDGEPMADGKRRLALPAGLSPDPVPLRAILVLGARQGTQGAWRRLPRAEALQAILRHRWQSRCAGWYGVEAGSFQDCAKLAETVAVFAVNAPDGLDHLPDFCTRLKHQIASLG